MFKANTTKGISVISAALLAGAAFAEEYVYTTDLASVTFDEIRAQIASDYSMPDFEFDDTVDLKFVSTASLSQANLVGAGGLTLGKFSVESFSRIRIDAANGTSVKIGTFEWNQSAQQWGSRIIGGNWEFGNINIIQDGTDPSAGFCFGEATTGIVQSLKVSGNITGRISQFRVGTSTAEYDATAWDNPGIDVKGYLSSQTKFDFYAYAGQENGHLYNKFGAINQSVNIGFVSRDTSAEDFTTINIMITGGKSTIDGGIADMSGNVTSIVNNGTNPIKMAVFMNSSDGSLVQKFSGSSLKIEGGVTVMSGTLLVNFKETSGVNHGDLTMEGGRFGSSNAAGGSFLFTDLVYSGGTIELALDSAEAFDSLRLSGTVQLVDGFDGKVSFDFGDNLAWLIDSEENGGNGVKVIAWAAGTVGADSFAANSYAGEDGLEYVADFTSEADGLYVKYVAVPEPSTVAALMGVLALVFAARRRRG